MQSVNHLILATSLILLASAGVEARGRYEYPLSQQLEIEPGTKVIIENSAGDIELRQGSPGQLTIGGKKVVKASSQRIADAEAKRIKIEVEKGKGKVRIWVEDGHRSRILFGIGKRVSSWADLSLLIPPRSHLEVNSTSGDIRAKGMEGRLIAKTVSGDLSLEGFVGPVFVHTTSGDLNLRGIVGDVKVEGTSSDVDLAGIKGNIEISTTSGDVSSQDVEGHLTVEGTSGDVQITRLRGDLEVSLHSGELSASGIVGGVKVETTSGDVYIGTSLLGDENYRVDTSSGDVTFKIKETSSFNLVIDTASGEIDVKAPLVIKSISRNRLIGRVGAGGPMVRITTASGDVELFSR